MEEIAIPTAGAQLQAMLSVPQHPLGAVVFVHGSGVDRHDVRDVHVARSLHEEGYVALQPELLQSWQTLERHNVFDIDLQCAHLEEAIDWLGRQRWGRNLPLGLFGAGIGAGVALLAAARRTERVSAVVCRGGRPDVALYCLPRVKAPTLLLVDAAQAPYVLAYDKLGGIKKMSVVATPSGRFEEPEALDVVSRLSHAWFAQHLGRGRAI